MKRCHTCHSFVQGDWTYCPLCQTPLGQPEENTQKNWDTFPLVPLQFNRQRTLLLLANNTILLIVLYFLYELIISHETRALDYVVLGLLSMWMMVYILVRKRRNIAKALFYLLVSLLLLSVYFDYIYGWKGWSVTYAIPMICSASLIAISIAVRVNRMAVGEYILYLELAALLGFIPSIFLLLGMPFVNWPSWLSIILSGMIFIFVSFRHKKALFAELAKRMDI